MKNFVIEDHVLSLSLIRQVWVFVTSSHTLQWDQNKTSNCSGKLFWPVHRCGWMDEFRAKNINLKFVHRDANGRLKIVAPGIEFVSNSVTIENEGKMDFTKFEGWLMPTWRRTLCMEIMMHTLTLTCKALNWPNSARRKRWILASLKVRFLFGIDLTTSRAWMEIIQIPTLNSQVLQLKKTSHTLQWDQN